MTKAELVASIAGKSGLSKKDSELALNVFITSVEEALGNGDNVKLAGFGVFEVRDMAGRNGTNPQTGEAIKIPASKKVKFKPSSKLKDLIKQA